MDNATVIVLENVTLSFLNEQFFGVLDVREVNLVSQSVDHSSFNATRKSRDVRVLNGRRLKTISKNGNDIRESMMRSLAESSSSQPSLIVLLNVDGAVSNWTPFDAAIDGQDIDDSISTVLAQDISSNYESFMTELAEDSEFFPNVTNQTPSSAVTDSNHSEANDNTNQKIVIIFGAVAAFVALVGSKLYMERRSAGTKQRRRRSDVDGREESAYDLSRVMKSSEDNFGDECSPSVEKAKQDEEVATYDGGCVACLGPMNLKSPQKEKIDARMTSLLDQVCIKLLHPSAFTPLPSLKLIPFIAFVHDCVSCRLTPPSLSRNKMKYLHWTCPRSSSRQRSNERTIIYTCSPTIKHLLLGRTESSQTTV